MINIKIVKKFHQMTIKEFLLNFHMSKSKIHKIKDDIYLNDKKAHLEKILMTDDLLNIDFKALDDHHIVPVKGDIKIIYEDDDVLIVDKPTQLLVHSDGQTNETLTNYVKYNYQDYVEAILPAHRLDYDTSGLLIFGKHPLSIAYLSYLFEQQDIEKTYQAVVLGTVKDEKGQIDKPIGKDRHSNKQRVSLVGKSALTSYKVIKRLKDRTLLEVMIAGGRKHQIRVHLSYLDHPIVGDQLYNQKKHEYKRLMLHFKKVRFLHPTTRKKIECESTYSLNV